MSRYSAERQRVAFETATRGGPWADRLAAALERVLDGHNQQFITDRARDLLNEYQVERDPR